MVLVYQSPKYRQKEPLVTLAVPNWYPAQVQFKSNLTISNLILIAQPYHHYLTLTQVQTKQICEAHGEHAGGSPESDVILPY